MFLFFRAGRGGTELRYGNYMNQRDYKGLWNA
jgi:hypothetical protein